jgi:hypothetical protein
VRLYLENDIDVALVERLQQWGHDVLITREAGNTESADEQ